MSNDNGFTVQDYKAGLCSIEQLPTKERKILRHSYDKIDMRLTIQEMKESGREFHLSNQIIKTAYGYMLETNCGTVDALEFAALRHSKDIDLVLAEKGRSIKGGVIVKDYDGNPIQKDMVKREVFNRQALKNSKNVWQLLNTLSTFRSIYERLVELELQLKDVSKRTTKLETQVEDNSYELKKVKDLTGIETEVKDRAKELYRKEHDKNIVAEVLGVNITTVRRWWKEFDNEL